MDKRSRHLALFTLCIFFASGLGAIHLASAGGHQWCVASQGASDTALQAALDYACGVIDCSKIQPGATCYNPNTVRDHASYAFNKYYHKNPQPSSCVFGGVATLTSNNPSHGNCKYASSKTSISPPTPDNPPSQPTPTPSVPSPPTPGTGSPPSVPSPQTPGTSSPPSKPSSTPSTPNPPTQGSPPATPTVTPLAPNPPSPGQEESPGGATSMSYSLLVFLACGLLASLQLAKSI